MNKLRAATLSAVAAATFVGAAGSSNPEKLTQPASPQAEQPERPPAAEMVEMKVAAACAALGELRGILGSDDSEPLRMFSDGEKVFKAAIFSPEEVQKQADDIEATLMVGTDAVRGDRLGIDGLATIATSRQAADATADVFEQFTDYEDPLEAAATIDQSGAAALIDQAREATGAAIQTNCN